MKPPVQEWTAAAVQLAEKAFATWLQAFIVALLGTTFFESLNFSVLAAAAVAVIPAGITVLSNAATSTAAPSTWPPRGQALFRVVRTFVATFLSFLAAAVWTLDVTSTRALVLAAAAAAGTAFLAAIKAELATFVGDPRTTAMIPARYEQSALAA